MNTTIFFLAMGMLVGLTGLLNIVMATNRFEEKTLNSKLLNST